MSAILVDANLSGFRATNMPNKECTVNNTVYELVCQTDTSTPCSGCVARHYGANTDTPSKKEKALCYSLDACADGCKISHVWILKEIK